MCLIPLISHMRKQTESLVVAVMVVILTMVVVVVVTNISLVLCI